MHLKSPYLTFGSFGSDLHVDTDEIQKEPQSQLGANISTHRSRAKVLKVRVLYTGQRFFIHYL